MAVFIYFLIFDIPPKNVAWNLILNNNHNKVYGNHTCKSLAVNLSEVYLYYLMASIQQMLAKILKKVWGKQTVFIIQRYDLFGDTLTKS